MQKHDLVRLIETAHITRPDGYDYRVVAAGSTGTITSVKSVNIFHVKFEGIDGVRRVLRENIAVIDGEEQAQLVAEREQREAEKKAEEAAFKASLIPGEGDILPDDPRIAWLWRKAANLPSVKTHCGVYDSICDELGIPGRPRDFSISFSSGGLTLSTIVRGTSKKDAEQKVQEKFPDATRVRAS